MNMEEPTPEEIQAFFEDPPFVKPIKLIQVSSVHMTILHLLLSAQNLQATHPTPLIIMPHNFLAHPCSTQSLLTSCLHFSSLSTLIDISSNLATSHNEIEQIVQDTALKFFAETTKYDKGHDTEILDTEDKNTAAMVFSFHEPVTVPQATNTTTTITNGALGQYSHSSSFLSQTMTQRQEFPDSLNQCIGGHDSIEKYKHYIKPETLEDGFQ